MTSPSVRSLPRRGSSRALAGAALLALLAGYADLVLGGVTIGPLLLVIAHVVLVPAALLAA